MINQTESANKSPVASQATQSVTPPNAPAKTLSRDNFNLTPIEDPYKSPKIEPKNATETKSSLYVCDSKKDLNKLCYHLQHSNDAKNFVLLSLSNPVELEYLLEKIQIDDSGKLIKTPGSLQKLFEEGGTLCLLYDDSIPKIVESLNSLFDCRPRFNGKEVSPQLKIIGLLTRDTLTQTKKYSGAFYSRFHETFLPVADQLKEEPPITKCLSIEATNISSKHVIDLKYNTNWKDILLGSIQQTTQGTFAFTPGLLCEVLTDKPKQLILRNAPKTSPLFQHFINTLLSEQKLTINGIEYPLENLEILFSEGYTFKEIENYLENKTLYKLSSNQLPRNNYISINSHNIHQLFSLSSCNEGRLIASEGLLNINHSPHIYITSNLEDSQWIALIQNPSHFSIYLDSEVELPPELKLLLKDHIRAVPTENSKLTNQETSPAVEIIYSNEPALSLHQQQQKHPQAIVFDISKDTHIGDLVESFVSNSAGYRHVISEIAYALEKQQPVILKNLGRNDSLTKELQSLLSDPPFFILNGHYIEIKGPLVLLEDTQSPHKLLSKSPYCRTEIFSSDDTLKAITQEFPFLKEEDFKKITLFFETLNQLPKPTIQKSYPVKNPLTYNKLKLICKQLPLEPHANDWYRAIKTIVLNHYQEDCSILAYLRTALKIHFPNNKTGTVNIKKINKIFEKVSQASDIEAYFWELTAAFSSDLLLGQAGLDPFLDFKETPKKNNQKFLNFLASCCCKKYSELQDYYPQLFKRLFPDLLINVDVSNIQTKEYVIDIDNRWKKQLALCANALEKNPVIFLKGAPGVGKSFITKQISERLGNASLLGPMTIGPDTCKEDLTPLLKDWIKAGEDTRVLVFDEANLAKEGLWDILEGIFSPKPYLWIEGKKINLDHPSKYKIIMTGNAENLAGRNYHRTLTEQCTHLYFKDFSSEYMSQNILAPILSHTLTDLEERNKILKTCITFHEKVQKLVPQHSFSARDFQEIGNYFNFLKSTTSPSNSEKCLFQALRHVYCGLLDKEQQSSIQLFFSISHPSSESMLEYRECSMTAKFIETLGESFVMTPLSKNLAQSILDVIDFREAKLASFIQFDPKFPGKLGMLFEGSSGIGKDDLLAHILLKKGFQSLSLTSEPDPDQDSKKICYHLNAGTQIDVIEKTILKARKEGSIVILSEMNLLPSNFLEGKCNDALTGNAEQGFFVFATLNPSSFQGREHLSSALLNRMIVEKMGSYSDAELFTILSQKLPHLNELDKKQILDKHLTSIQNLSRIKRAPVPTPRQIFQVIQKIHHFIPLEQTLKQVYCLFDLFGSACVETTTEKETYYFQSYAYLLKLLTDKAKGLQVSESVSIPNGYFDPKTKVITLKSSANEQHMQAQIILQGIKAEHTPLLNAECDCPKLFDRMSNLRALEIAKHYFPKININLLQELDLESDAEKKIKTFINSEDTTPLIIELQEISATDCYVACLALLAQYKLTEEDISKLMATLPHLSIAIQMAHTHQLAACQYIQSAHNNPLDRVSAHCQVYYTQLIDGFIDLQQHIMWDKTPKQSIDDSKRAIADPESINLKHHSVSSDSVINELIQGPSSLSCDQSSSSSTYPQHHIAYKSKVTTAPKNDSKLSYLANTKSINGYYFATSVSYELNTQGIAIYGPLSHLDRLRDKTESTVEIEHIEMAKPFNLENNSIKILIPLKMQPSNIRVSGKNIGSSQLIIDTNGTYTIKIIPENQSICLEIDHCSYGLSKSISASAPKKEPIQQLCSNKPLKFTIDYSLSEALAEFKRDIAQNPPQKMSEKRDKILKLQHLFNENFTYSRSESTRDEWISCYNNPQTNVINHYLQFKKGVCAESALAMFAIVKDLFPELPSRLVGGHTATGGWIVSELHNWIEVFFDDTGFIVFDPTAHTIDEETQEILERESPHMTDIITTLLQKKVQQASLSEDICGPIIKVLEPIFETENPGDFLPERIISTTLNLTDTDKEILAQHIREKVPFLFSMDIDPSSGIRYTDSPGILDLNRACKGSITPFINKSASILGVPKAIILVDRPLNTLQFAILENLLNKSFDISILTVQGLVSVQNIQQVNAWDASAENSHRSTLDETDPGIAILNKSRWIELESILQASYRSYLLEKLKDEDTFFPAHKSLLLIRNENPVLKTATQEGDYSKLKGFDCEYDTNKLDKEQLKKMIAAGAVVSKISFRLQKPEDFLVLIEEHQNNKDLIECSIQLAEEYLLDESIIEKLSSLTHLKILSIYASSSQIDYINGLELPKKIPTIALFTAIAIQKDFFKIEEEGLLCIEKKYINEATDKLKMLPDKTPSKNRLADALFNFFLEINEFDAAKTFIQYIEDDYIVKNKLISKIRKKEQQKFGPERIEGMIARGNYQEAYLKMRRWTDGYLKERNLKRLLLDMKHDKVKNAPNSIEGLDAFFLA